MDNIKIEAPPSSWTINIAVAPKKNWQNFWLIRI